MIVVLRTLSGRRCDLAVGGAVEFHIVRAADASKFFWRLADEEGRLLTYSSVCYSSSAECLAAVKALRAAAGAAGIVDLTDDQRRVSAS